MSAKSTRPKSVKITRKVKDAYEKRNRSLDHSDVPQLPPQMWGRGTVGKYYRPLKTQISVRVDNEVLDWLKSKGAGHLTRINEILRDRMLTERK